MGQKKLIRFAELETFSNVLQYPEEMKGKWNRFFQQTAPITLELACGKGEYTVGMGRLFPGRNFLGVDLKGNRIWSGARTALREGLTNVGFLRTQIDRIDTYFEKGEVSDIWLTFPDPQLRLSRARKRLTHPKFLRLYREFLSAESRIHLKTDSPVLFAFTLAVIELYQLKLVISTDDLYRDYPEDPVLGIKTHYEKLDIAGKQRVHYIQFQLDGDLPPSLDESLKNMLRERETD